MTKAAEKLLKDYIEEAEVKGEYIIHEIIDPYNTGADGYISPTIDELEDKGLYIELKREVVIKMLVYFLDEKMYVDYDEVQWKDIFELAGITTAIVDFKKDGYEFKEIQVELRWI